MRSAVVACLVALALAVPVQANTIRVPGDQPVIQAGLDAASAGDTVLVAPGTYAGPGNRNLSFAGRDLVLLSEAGAEVTIVDGGGSAVGIEFRNAETVASIVEGFTITNCATGIYCIYTAPPNLPSAATIRYCALVSCSVCIHADSGGSLFAEHCEIEGPVFCGYTSGGSPAAYAGLTHCLLTGAARVAGAATLTDCVFAGIDMTGNPLLSTYANTLWAVNCTFTDNVATIVSVRGDSFSYGSMFLRGCTFTGNTGYSLSAGARSLLDIEHCTFSGNLGSALYLPRLFEGQDRTLRLKYTIIAFYDGGPVVLYDNLGATNSTVTCCDIYGNEGGDWIGFLANYYGVNGNISEDPLFCDAPNRDFTLDADSPCAPEHSGGCGLIGAWPVGCGATSVALEEASSPWIGLRVHPNPIRTSATVEWMSEVGAPAVLRLFDPKGRLVLARDLETRGSGLQHVTWTDLLGSRELDPGVYYLELGRAKVQHERASVVVIR